MFCRPLLSVVLLRKDTNEFTQQEDRKKRTANRLCVTNVTGLLLGSFFVGIPLTLMFSGLLQNDLFKGRCSLVNCFSNKNIVTIVTQRLPSSFLSHLVA